MLTRITYVYCADTLLNCDDPMMIDITKSSIDRVMNDQMRPEQPEPQKRQTKRNQKVSPNKSESTRTNTMDRESS